MSLNIEIKGFNRVRNSLRALARLHPETTDPVMERWARATAKVLKRTKYPPKRPGQRYRRTGRLASSWKARRAKRGEWEIANSAQFPRGKFYAAFVVGEEQAWMHRGRWWIAKDIIQDEVKELTRALTEELERIMARGR